eukprot:scaffold2895_cov161-Prasinococcus_capsulatus_cf.AAC.2
MPSSALPGGGGPRYPVRSEWAWALGSEDPCRHHHNAVPVSPRTWRRRKAWLEVRARASSARELSQPLAGDCGGLQRHRRSGEGKAVRGRSVCAVWRRRAVRCLTRLPPQLAPPRYHCRAPRPHTCATALTRARPSVDALAAVAELGHLQTSAATKTDSNRPSCRGPRK